MPIWAFQKRIIGNPTPEKAAFVSSFADCDELFVINQRFLKKITAETGADAACPKFCKNNKRLPLSERMAMVYNRNTCRYRWEEVP